MYHNNILFVCKLFIAMLILHNYENLREFISRFIILCGLIKFNIYNKFQKSMSRRILHATWLVNNILLKVIINKLVTLVKINLLSTWFKKKNVTIFVLMFYCYFIFKLQIIYIVLVIVAYSIQATQYLGNMYQQSKTLTTRTTTQRTVTGPKVCRWIYIYIYYHSNYKITFIIIFGKPLSELYKVFRQIYIKDSRQEPSNRILIHWRNPLCSLINIYCYLDWAVVYSIETRRRD